MKTNVLVARGADAVAIALLVFGNAGAQTFVAVAVWGMVALAVVGVVWMDDKLAKALQDAPLWSLLVAWGFHLAYVAALIASGRPVLAAAHLILVALLRQRAHEHLEKLRNGQ